MSKEIARVKDYARSKAMEQEQTKLYSNINEFMMSAYQPTKILVKVLGTMVENSILSLKEINDIDLINDKLSELNEDIINLSSVINLVEDVKEYNDYIRMIESN